MTVSYIGLVLFMGAAISNPLLAYRNLLQLEQQPMYNIPQDHLDAIQNEYEWCMNLTRKCDFPNCGRGRCSDDENLFKGYCYAIGILKFYPYETYCSVVSSVCLDISNLPRRNQTVNCNGTVVRFPFDDVLSGCSVTYNAVCQLPPDPPSPPFTPPAPFESPPKPPENMDEKCDSKLKLAIGIAVGVGGGLVTILFGLVMYLAYKLHIR